MVGEECSQERHNLEVTYPVVNGIIQHWENMQHVWDHTFHEQLQIDPSDCKILLTDPPLNPKGNREKLLQTMFETYGFAAAFIQIQAVLTLYAQGETHLKELVSCCHLLKLKDSMLMSQASAFRP